MFLFASEGLERVGCSPQQLSKKDTPRLLTDHTYQQLAARRGKILNSAPQSKNTNYGWIDYILRMLIH